MIAEMELATELTPKGLLDSRFVLHRRSIKYPVNRLIDTGRSVLGYRYPMEISGISPKEAAAYRYGAVHGGSSCQDGIRRPHEVFRGPGKEPAGSHNARYDENGRHQPKKFSLIKEYPRKKLSPPELARYWGIGADKVLTWIRSGELRAINAATKRGGRPRYLIDAKDIEAFEKMRSVTTTPPAPRRRKATSDGITEYF